MTFNPGNTRKKAKSQSPFRLFPKPPKRLAALNPEKKPVESWWLSAPREGFMAEARRRQDITNESTLGLYTGRKPTSVLQPNGWETQFDV